MKKLIVLGLLLISCQGKQGQTGPAGLNGTVITMVQFCPGVVSQYPTTFPEVGFCINNSIWAVYSIPDAFLTEIPPGLWKSEAIGSACTFLVQPNCIVVPQ